MGWVRLQPRISTPSNVRETALHALHAHRYKRDDGLDLTATLYLPPGYDRDRDERLPCLLWAYPREFKTKVRLPPVTQRAQP